MLLNRQRVRTKSLAHPAYAHTYGCGSVSPLKKIWKKGTNECNTWYDVL